MISFRATETLIRGMCFREPHLFNSRSRHRKFICQNMLRLDSTWDPSDNWPKSSRGSRTSRTSRVLVRRFLDPSESWRLLTAMSKIPRSTPFSEWGTLFVMFFLLARGRVCSGGEYTLWLISETVASQLGKDFTGEGMIVDILSVKWKLLYCLPIPSTNRTTSLMCCFNGGSFFLAFGCLFRKQGKRCTEHHFLELSWIYVTPKLIIHQIL